MCQAFFFNMFLGMLPIRRSPDVAETVPSLPTRVMDAPVALYGKACCTSMSQAQAPAAQAVEPACARQTLAAIAMDDADLLGWADAEPESAVALARGLQRWLAWTGERPAQPVQNWIDMHTARD